MLRMDQEEGWSLSRALAAEWLEVNRRGGYASSSILNCHTRRYHGLLVARLVKPAGCYVLLSKFEDMIICGGIGETLSCHQYPGDFFPADRSFLKTFQLGIVPTFLYEGQGIRLRKSLLMPAAENGLLIRYDIESCPVPGVVQLRPFLAFRDFHGLSKENTFLLGETTVVKNGASFRLYAGMPALVIQTNRRPEWSPEPLWYRNFEYAAEAARGYPCHEDLFTPGVFRIPVRAGSTVIVHVAPEPFFGKMRSKWDAEVRRRRQESREDESLAEGLAAAPAQTPAGGTAATDGCPDIVTPTEEETPVGMSSVGSDYAGVNPAQEREKTATGDGAEGLAAEKLPFRAAEERQLIRLLLQAGRRFLIRTPSGRPAVIAGYHWFGEWGRDTLISLPGLTFCSGRSREGLEILIRMARFERHGLLPNIFAEGTGDHAFNAVDVPLWYFWAVQQLLRHEHHARTKTAVEKNLWPVLKDILRHYLHGTLFNIYMDDNGLLHAGAGDRALTWMDACIDNHPVTPRHGYPVEINALWYNAVCFAAELARQYGGDREFHFDELIPRIRRSFRETFWSPEDACLGDVFHQGRLDRSVRPNQLFAVSLPYSPLEAEQGRLIVAKVKSELLTPVGIRTLSPRDDRYRGRYEGPPAARDGAYHQGTVWPWLLGPFGEAWLRVAADREAAKAGLRAYLFTFLTNHFREAGLGCISEVFDGDPPHRPGGCIAQAWSTAELIRLYSLLGG